MKTMIKNTREAVQEYIDSLTTDELVNVWNDYAREAYPDDEIYFNDEEFFNVYFEGKVLEAVRAVSYGEYRYTDEYVIFNGYGNLETFNDPSNHIDMQLLVDDVLENPSRYNIELEEE